MGGRTSVIGGSTVWSGCQWVPVPVKLYHYLTVCPVLLVILVRTRHNTSAAICCSCVTTTNEIYKSRPQAASGIVFTWQYDMLLYPPSSSPWNTTFRNTERQIIYKTEFLTRYGVPHQITIKRILPSSSIDHSFTDLAEIHYENFSSRIRYNGTEMATTNFFRKSGFMGRWELVDCFQFYRWQYSTSHYKIYRHRVFTGPDGKEYEWELSETKFMQCNSN